MAWRSVHKRLKLVTNITRGISSDNGGQNLETIKSFKCLGSVMTDKGSKREFSPGLPKQLMHCQNSRPRKAKNIALSSKIRMVHSLAISIFLCACKTWTLTAELESKIQATEMRCFRRLLGISYMDHVTNEEVRHAIGLYKDLITTVRNAN